MVVPMRVIGGRSRGRRLAAKLPTSVRPTSDRVRESIFDILGSRGGVEGLACVDLFCGSGALGVEALSRGARLGHLRGPRPRRARSRAARTSTRSGWATSRVDTGAGVAARVARSPGPARAFDLALCDPPYDFADWPALLERAAGRRSS